MKLIPVGRLHEAIIDDVDFDTLSNHKWRLLERRYKEKVWVYATTRIEGKTILMHRFLINAKPAERVDHVNGDGLDNRRLNMRICSHLQNMQNKRPYSNNKCGYKGVHKERKDWVARIKVDGKCLRLGRFASAFDAAKAYDMAAVQHYGKFAWLNFHD